MAPKRAKSPDDGLWGAASDRDAGGWVNSKKRREHANSFNITSRRVSPKKSTRKRRDTPPEFWHMGFADEQEPAPRIAPTMHPTTTKDLIRKDIYNPQQASAPLTHISNPLAPRTSAAAVPWRTKGVDPRTVVMPVEALRTGVAAQEDIIDLTED